MCCCTIYDFSLSQAMCTDRVAGVTSGQEYNFEQFSDGTLVYRPVKSDNFWTTLDMTEASATGN